ncbi:hypothetical protein CRUP_025583 [Coryphaenoides rupestris]|nr:hypothetical protein CRUP_025583 [Coryphaenoides rupestris]
MLKNGCGPSNTLVLEDPPTRWFWRTLLHAGSRGPSYRLVLEDPPTRWFWRTLQHAGSGGPSYTLVLEDPPTGWFWRTLQHAGSGGPANTLVLERKLTLYLDDKSVVRVEGVEVYLLAQPMEQKRRWVPLKRRVGAAVPQCSHFSASGWEPRGGRVVDRHSGEEEDRGGAEEEETPTSWEEEEEGGLGAVTPPSREAMDAPMVSRGPAAGPRASARPAGVPSELCLAPTIWTGMWGGGGGAAWEEEEGEEEEGGGGAGRMGGGVREGS